MTSSEKIFWGAFAALVVLGIGAAVVYRLQTPMGTGPVQSIQAPVTDPSTLPGIVATQSAWEANTGTLPARMDAIGMPKLSMEGAVMHEHQQLSVFVDGKLVTIPANIGIAGFFSPIHTHDALGIVHVEAPFVADFTLGHFFDVWGVKFTNTAIGGYAASDAKPLRVYVNGEQYSGDFRSLSLESRDVIAVVYGALPSSIPSTYAFPAGY